MQKDKKEPGPSRSRLGVKIAVGLLLLFMGAALILCVILYFVAEYRRGIQEKIAQKLDGLRKLEIEISLDELQKKFPPLDENRNGAVVFQNAFLQYVRDEQSYELQDSKLLEDPRSSLPDEVADPPLGVVPLGRAAANLLHRRPGHAVVGYRHNQRIVHVDAHVVPAPVAHNGIAPREVEHRRQQM